MCVSASRSHPGRENPPEERYHVLWLFSFLNQHSKTYVSGLDLKRMGAPGGVEPPTNGLGNRCSIQLSYGATRARLAVIGAETTKTLRRL